MLVVTNLTQDHLDFHGTMDEYYAAKEALFAQAERAVVNVGDEWGRRLAESLPAAKTFTPDDELGEIDLKLRGPLSPPLEDTITSRVRMCVERLMAPPVRAARSSGPRRAWQRSSGISSARRRWPRTPSRRRRDR